MKVNDIIGEMADRAFAFSFLQGINDLYAARDYGCTEPDYQAGINHLLTVLTDEQKEALNRMESTYTERRYYAAEYGLSVASMEHSASSLVVPEQKTEVSRSWFQMIF